MKIHYLQHVPFEDVESAYHLLIKLGVKTSQIKNIWGAKAFYFFDPEGYRVELWA